MTRGKPPRLAIREGLGIAAKKGHVRDVTGEERAPYDFILFLNPCTVFVRVRRVRVHIANPIELVSCEETRQLRTLPQTAVVSREIWTRAPWGTWQYFRVLDDQLIEIHRDRPQVPAATSGLAPDRALPETGICPYLALAGT